MQEMWWFGHCKGKVLVVLLTYKTNRLITELIFKFCLTENTTVRKTAKWAYALRVSSQLLYLSNTIGSSRESNPSCRIWNLRGTNRPERLGESCSQKLKTIEFGDWKFCINVSQPRTGLDRAWRVRFTAGADRIRHIRRVAADSKGANSLRNLLNLLNFLCDNLKNFCWEVVLHCY